MISKANKSIIIHMHNAYLSGKFKLFKLQLMAPSQTRERGTQPPYSH